MTAHVIYHNIDKFNTATHSKKVIKLIRNDIKYKHILLGGLHNLHSIKSPAFTPAKAKFMIRDCKLIAEKNKIKFKFNSYFPIKTLSLMRGTLIADEDGFQSFYIDKIFVVMLMFHCSFMFWQFFCCPLCK